MPAQRQTGFTVVELLVAVAVLAAVLIPIMEATGAVTRRHVRQGETMQMLERQRSAITILRTVNPMIEPDGRRSLGAGQEVRWHAVAVTRRARALRFLGGEGRFEVALYRLSVTLPAAAPFEVDALGWRDTERASGRERFFGE